MTLLTLALAEAAGGAVAGALADAVLYAMDSAKVRAQTGATSSTRNGQWRILFRGLAPTVLLGSVPVFGIFFLLYAPIKFQLQQRQQQQQQQGQKATTDHTNSYTSNSVLLPAASVLCAIPATIMGVPADVLKKRVVTGLDPSVRSAVQRLLAEQGLAKGLFNGWRVNLLRDLPFAGVKLGLYEALVQQYQQIRSESGSVSPLGAALCGTLSGVGTAVITCPLDVVNTHMKTGQTIATTGGIVAVAKDIVRNGGVSALFRGVLLRSVVLGVGSLIFWPLQRMIANVILQEEQTVMVLQPLEQPKLKEPP